jgi:hypothetical protein
MTANANAKKRTAFPRFVRERELVAGGAVASGIASRVDDERRPGFPAHR